jgi:saccharopine dehydrogenase (NAD+, L-lysine-forming)
MSADSKAVVVAGGAGAMGRITVRDLFETAPELSVVVADYDERAARQLARQFKSRRVRAAALDVTDVRGAAAVFRGAFAVVNAVQYQHNVKVMRAALAARAHYCDLGGLFHVTREQRKLDAAFRRADRLALLGIGAAPGVSNLLARMAADEMDEVREIHIQLGSVDLSPATPLGPLGTSYSIETILDEASRPAAILQDGKIRFVEPMSGAIDVQFPAPVGLRRPALTLHSEVANLAESYRKKGLRECTFRIDFGAELSDKLRFLHALGLTSTEKVGTIVPRDALRSLLRRLPRPAPRTTPPNEYEIIRAVVRGSAGEEVVDCHVRGIPEWGFGMDVDTGCPPSAAVQMLLRGDITARGALPPERAVPPAPFFAELLKRGMTVQRQKR